MKFSYLILSLLSFVSLTNAEATVCGNSPETTFYINDNSDLENFKTCNIVNGSLFINGGYDITSLEKLSNITEITGYLNIMDSHVLTNLKGLHNLQKIYGNNLYLNTYSLSIKHNNNFLNDSHHGLCYPEKVAWSNIIENGNIITNNNGLNCPNCYNECNGCYGPGPYLCQSCLNFESGNACIETCYGGIKESNICLESKPNSPALNFSNLGENTLDVSWTEPTQPGGFIYKYTLFQDSQEVFTTNYNDNNYHLNNLDMSYSLNNLSPSTTYDFYVLAYNNNGTNEIVNYPITTWATPTPQPTNQPTQEPTKSPTKSPTSSPTKEPTVAPTVLLGPPSNIHIDNLTSTTAVIHWGDDYGNLQESYYLELYHDSNLINNYSTYFNLVELNNLQSYYQYGYRVKTIHNNDESEFSLMNYFTTKEDLPGVMEKPNLYSHNESVMIVQFSNPDIENGHITQYEILMEDIHGFTFKYNFSINESYPNSINDNNTFQVVINNLLPNTRYMVEMRSYTIIGAGIFSEPSFLTMPIGKPPIPDIPQIYNVYNNRVDLSVKKVSEIYGDIIYFNVIVNDITTENKTSHKVRFNNFNQIYIINNLQTYHTYTFNLEACTHDDLCSTSLESDSVMIDVIQPDSSTEDNNLNTLEIIGISLGAFFFLIAVFFIYKSYKKHQENKNRARLSRLTGRVVTNKKESGTVSFKNPTYIDPLDDNNSEIESVEDIESSMESVIERSGEDTTGRGRSMVQSTYQTSYVGNNTVSPIEEFMMEEISSDEDKSNPPIYSKVGKK